MPDEANLNRDVEIQSDYCKVHGQPFHSACKTCKPIELLCQICETIHQIRNPDHKTASIRSSIAPLNAELERYTKDLQVSLDEKRSILQDLYVKRLSVSLKSRSFRWFVLCPFIRGNECKFSALMYQNNIISSFPSWWYEFQKNHPNEFKFIGIGGTLWSTTYSYRRLNSLYAQKNGFNGTLLEPSKLNRDNSIKKYTSKGLP